MTYTGPLTGQLAGRHEQNGFLEMKTTLGGLLFAPTSVLAAIYGRVVYRMPEEVFDVYCQEREAVWGCPQGDWRPDDVE